MRATAFVFFAVFLATALTAICAETKAENNEPNYYSVFSNLTREDASNKAREMAEADFARKVYRLFVVGKRPVTSAYDEYLKQRYGVVMAPIAGCIVSDGMVGAQEGYNSTMRPLLNGKFGRDIFKEAEEASRK